MERGGSGSTGKKATIGTLDGKVNDLTALLLEGDNPDSGRSSNALTSLFSAMPTRAVLFDFDGVIADTENIHIAAWQRTLARRRKAPSVLERG